MQRVSKSPSTMVLSVLLSLLVASTLFVAMPTKAFAAQTIDISSLGTVVVSGETPGTDSWTYDGLNVLDLNDAGPYTLTGASTRLYIVASGNNAQVTLRNVDIEQIQGGSALILSGNNCTLTLEGANRIESDIAVLRVDDSCIINGSGSLTASPIAGGGIEIDDGATLSIIDSASVTVSGTSGSAIWQYGTDSILMGDAASLTMTNNTTATETHVFEVYNPASTEL